MSPWRRTVLDRLSAMPTAELQEAMQEVKASDTNKRLAPDGHVMRLAVEVAPLMQTKPEHAASIISKAVIYAAAYRFAGLPLDDLRLT